MSKELIKSNTIEGEIPDQTPIEIMLQIDENGNTTARKLYIYLELAQGQFARWSKKNIIENSFVEENEDYEGFDIDVEGNIVKDYSITASFAKKLCMSSQTNRGEQARNYFIKVEDMLREKSTKKTLVLPEDYESALETLLLQVKKNKQLQITIEENKPKIDMYEKLMNGKNYLDMNEVAHGMDIGRNTLFKYLRSLGVLMKSNIPYQQFMEQGYFKVIYVPLQMGERFENKPKTLVSSKGLEFIHKKLKTLHNT